MLYQHFYVNNFSCSQFDSTINLSNNNYIYFKLKIGEKSNREFDRNQSISIFILSLLEYLLICIFGVYFNHY